MSREFWKSAGIHLLECNQDGWLQPSPDFLRAYYTRPELHPIDTSCAVEIELHDALMQDPFMAVTPQRLSAIADRDAAETYELVLGFRDELVAAGSLEGAYLSLIRPGARIVPPLFLDQLVHVILRNVLRDVRDPMQLRAAELFFRTQKISTDDGCVMLADEEIVAMHSANGGNGASGIARTGLGQLLEETGIGLRQVELDVLGEDNSDIYWQRSDCFDTVVDFRFEQPAPDAFARVIEGWLRHMMRLSVNVQPMVRIDDTDWRWHIGLDREASTLLNRLYHGDKPTLEEMARIIGLFQMQIIDERNVIDRVKGYPVYLALAMDSNNLLKMKPQNLLMNLPLLPPS